MSITRESYIIEILERIGPQVLLDNFSYLQFHGGEVDYIKGDFLKFRNFNSHHIIFYSTRIIIIITTSKVVMIKDQKGKNNDQFWQYAPKRKGKYICLHCRHIYPHKSQEIKKKRSNLTSSWSSAMSFCSVSPNQPKKLH